MYAKFKPILAVLLISAGMSQISAHDNHNHMQQRQITCGICHQHERLESDIFIVDCNSHMLMAHNDCMRTWLDQGHLNCPVCREQFSEQNLNLILTGLTGGDAVAQQHIPQQRNQQRNQLTPHADLFLQLPTQLCGSCFVECEQAWPYTVTLHCDHQYHVHCIHDGLHQQQQTACSLCNVPFNQEDREMIDAAQQFVHIEQHGAPTVPQQPEPQQQPAPQRPDQQQSDQQQQNNLTASEPVTCAICLEDLLDSKKESVLPCAHSFCTACIGDWLKDALHPGVKDNDTCPVCRAQVPADVRTYIVSQVRATAPSGSSTKPSRSAAATTAQSRAPRQAQVAAQSHRQGGTQTESQTRARSRTVQQQQSTGRGNFLRRLRRRRQQNRTHR